jgi:hypothetical protein
MMKKRRRKRVVGDYIHDKMERQPRGEEAVMRVLKMNKRRKILRKSMISDGYEQKRLIYHTKKEQNKPSNLKGGDIVRISAKTQCGIGRIGKIDEIIKDKVCVNIIFRDGIYIVDFPFKFFTIEKANKSEKNQYETLEERVYAKEVAEKL